MRSMVITSSMPVTDDEVVAALAAVSCLLSEEAPAQEQPASRPPWRTAALLEAQGLIVERAMACAGWGQTSRAPRARRWSRGIVGS